MNVKRRTHTGFAISLVSMLALLVTIIPQTAYAADPENKETVATVTFKPGELELLTVPEFDFGEHAISATTQAYPSTDADTPIEISDLRGSNEGWDLNVSLTPFTLADGTTESIQGSYIEINNAVVSAVNNTVGVKPTVDEEGIHIDSDSSETSIFKAVNSGGGVWQMTWDAEDATLTVLPGTVRTGENEATLTWSFQATP